MFWTARYCERAVAVSRVVQGYERLLLDLPGESPDLSPLLELVNSPPAADAARLELGELHRLLLFDLDNPSSVRGALHRARENLRAGGTVLPPAVWVTVNRLFNSLGELSADDPAQILAALDEVMAAASLLEGELATNTTRDAAYSFWRIGCRLERADMLLRTLNVLIPALTERGDRRYVDVRWTGILDCVGAYAMFRRRYHACSDLEGALQFLMVERGFPRGFVHLHASIENELDRLPRAGTLRAALAACRLEPGSFGTMSAADFASMATRLIETLAKFSAILADTYFPSQPSAEAGRPAPAKAAAIVPSMDPFTMLGREHAAVESVLELLDVLVNRTQRGLDVQRPELAALMDYFNDFGVLGHHEKEESILLPALLDAGFDWQDGPLSAMRRDHRQEHYFLRVLTHLSRLSDWSADDRRQFSSVASEFTQFLRNHMHFENQHVFAPARQRLSPTTLASLAAALSRFDTGSSPEEARERLQHILAKYEADVSASA
jgi:uncharacterized alpha-E superfamily protein/hemerythrin-like domain-containing protein